MVCSLLLLCHEGTSQIHLPLSTGLAGWLLTAAWSYGKLSGQCQMGANILYAAWALHSILESPLSSW